MASQYFRCDNTVKYGGGAGQLQTVCLDQKFATNTDTEKCEAEKAIAFRQAFCWRSGKDGAL